jgi:dihydrofolate reductase
VLTHYQREPLVIEGGTTFHFVTDGIESALAQAQAVPSDGNVGIAGGASTVNQYLDAGLLDELRLHITRSRSPPAPACSTASRRSSWSRPRRGPHRWSPT